MKKILLFTSIAFMAVTGAFGQTKGTITIYCFNQSTRESIDSVKVGLYRNDTMIASAVSDMYGGHDFKNLPSGNYSIRYSHDGYSSGITTVQLQPGGSQTANIGLVKKQSKTGTGKKKK